MPTNQELHASVDLRGLARDLDSVALGLGREVALAVRAAGDTILQAVPRFTPYDAEHHTTGDDPDRDQHLRDSFSLRTTGGTILQLVSSHPGALPWEFGGTIAPRGVDITIHEAAMARAAAEEQAPAYEGVLNARVDELLTQHGL
jgi:hypothetical protein